MKKLFGKDVSFIRFHRYSFKKPFLMKSDFFYVVLCKLGEKGLYNLLALKISTNGGGCDREKWW